MGLTARDMSDMGRLAQLATNPQDTTREELYLAVASLYRVQDTHLSDRERELMRDILRRLASDVEMTIRIALAERLAEDTSAPHDLILLLADDSIEVARPVILRSPLLTESDVLKLIAECSIAPSGSYRVAPQYRHSRNRCVGQMRSGNRIGRARAQCHGKDFVRRRTKLWSKNRGSWPSLQDPWPTEKIFPPNWRRRCALGCRTPSKPTSSRTMRWSRDGWKPPLVGAESVVTSEPAPPKTPPAESAAKLIEKLAMAGQLKAGFLLRVLHQGQIDLFDLAFARLLELPLSEARQNLYERGPKPVALACRAVGIDRCVFQTVFTLSRKARFMKPVLTPTDIVDVEGVFNSFTKTTALAELHKH